jgi:GNAT superfamily N-acetyltransferase
MQAGSVNRTLALAQAALSPGTGVVRAVRPDDCEAIRAFVSGLSPHALYLRFFASVSPPSTALLRTLCGLTGTADVLIVTDRRGAVIGHAMAADMRPAHTAGGPVETSVGLVIADDWQHHGLGTALFDLLVSRAVDRGVGRLVLDVLPENAAMRDMIARRWPDAPLERTRDALVYTPPIGPADARSPVALPALVDKRSGWAALPAGSQPAGHRNRSAA